jgi:hypothetical protein
LGEGLKVKTDKTRETMVVLDDDSLLKDGRNTIQSVK